MRTFFLFAVLSLTFPSWADQVRLRDNAPEKHVVVKGDTLWDISETFLKDPWQWPNVWRLNRDEISNPHLIYPGDVVRLSRDADGNIRLSLEKGPRIEQTVKLSPRAYGEPIIIKETGIPSIPERAIKPLLSRGGVGDPSDLDKAPRILGSRDARVMFGAGDRVFAGKGDGDTVDWRIVRLGQPIRNLDDKNEVLAYELIHLGEGQTELPGDPQLLRITHAEQEILERDRLLPAWKVEPIQYVPHAPDKPISARVAATLGGTVLAGAWMTVVLDKGIRDGLEHGHVLALYRAGRSVADPKCVRADKIAFLAGGEGHAKDCIPDKGDRSALPDTRVGLAFVYRVFNKVSYALVMKSEEQIVKGDRARNP
ncbi:MAG: LysM peptidoglycan-binding domain-containing protein [Pseudomonadota bacterium]|nr:LysM peptidoglycan-binding domain-containing protein [Pseudomonadota bacterium]MDP1903852.1 LysM peptidoglycan-binding domain-containing protein [Pseudomonadota bacterium]MDP2353650.1 LysM peptidoglycan-binding domain-containing protein [Pseudomonadota bacterium]